MPECASLQAGDPTELSGCRLLGRLGEGAQGVVFLGRDPAGQPVAVKMLHARLSGDAQARSGFLQEVAAAKQVAGFGTAQVVDADVAGDRPYVVSEYVEGPSLQRLVAEQGPRSGGALDRLAVGTAMALSAIHRAGVVHRDFKPANVLLGPEGPRVIDFGIARALDSTATRTTRAVGTPSYMAPEQLSRGTVGPAADVFAWGCTMVYAATGAPPFGNDTVAAVLTRVLTSEPDLSGVPVSIAGIVTGCLAKDPDARPGIRQVLDRILGEPDGVRQKADAAGAGVPPPRAATDAGTRMSLATASMPTVTRVPPAAAPAAPAQPPAPAQPAPPPDDPPRERSRRRRLLPVAAVVVLAVTAGAGVWWLGRGAGPERFTALTSGGCRMVSPSTVRKLVPQPSVDTDGQGPEHEAAFYKSGCSWSGSDLSSPAYRELYVTIAVQLDVTDPVVLDNTRDPVDGLQRAVRTIRSTRHDFRSKANRTNDNGIAVTYYGPTAELTGIGDEAVVLSRHQLADDSLAYDPEIVEIDARLTNAEIMVVYTSGDKAGRRMIPTPEPVVQKQAETVARELVDTLLRCAKCTR